MGDDVSQSSLVPASRLTRFANSLIDGLLISTINYGIQRAFGMDLFHAGSNSFWLSTSITEIIWLLYFTISETLWQRTLGKALTRTKVVSNQGIKASWRQILGRTLARAIPFEIFSFLSRKYPIGWHDSLSGTLVVKSEYSSEEVIAINKKVLSRNAVILASIFGFIAYILLNAGLYYLGKYEITYLNTMDSRNAAIPTTMNGTSSVTPSTDDSDTSSATDPSLDNPPLPPYKPLTASETDSYFK